MKNVKIFGVLTLIFSFGTFLTSCKKEKPIDETPAQEHKCHHVCSTCGKCTDVTCTDPVCANKCTCKPVSLSKEITGISLDIPETTEYRLSENLSEIIKYKIDFNDGTNVPGNTFVEEDFGAYIFEDGKVKSTAKVEIKNKEYTLEVNLPVQAAKTVSEIIEPANFDGTVEGLYVARKVSASKVTVALWDKEANKLMNVNFYDVATEDVAIEDGDLVRLPVNYGVYGGNINRLADCIISKGNDISTWDKVTNFPSAVKVELISQPENANYTHHDTIDTIDLYGAKIKVSYSDDTSYETAVTKEMLSGDWHVGKCEYSVTYEGCTSDVKLVINYVPTGISVEEFLSKGSGTFEVECIVIGAQTVYGTSELLVKDVNSNAMVGIWNSGVTGAWNDPTLNEEVVKKGDRIIVPLKRLNRASSSGADAGKPYADVSSFSTNMILISRDNPLTYNLEDSSITRITTQEEFKAWVEGDEKFYKMAILVNPRATFDGNTMYPFLAPQEARANFTYGGKTLPLFSPAINNRWTLGEGKIKEFFEEVSGTSYYQAKGNLYIVYQGGNSYQHVIDVINPDWFVKATVNDIEIDASNTVCTETTTISSLGIKYREIYSNGGFGEWKVIPTEAFGNEIIKDGKKVCSVSLTVDGKEYTKEISLTIIYVDSIEVYSMPTAVPNHRTTLETLDLTDAKIKVNYIGGSSDIIDMTNAMLSGEAMHIGENTLVVTYCEKTCEMKITAVSTALSIKEFKEKTSGQWDVEFVVIGASTVYGTSELLVKDPNSNETIGIWNSGITSAYNTPQITVDYIKQGDRIINKLTRTNRNAASSGVDGAKIYADCYDKITSQKFIKVSSDNSIKYDLTDSSIEVIDTQEKFKAWVESDDKFYKIARLVTPRVTGSDTQINPFFAPLEAKQNFTYNGFTLQLFATQLNWRWETTEGLVASFFTPVEGKSYKQAKGDVYVLYQGGNKYQHIIDILGDDWLVPSKATLEFDNVPTMVQGDFDEETIESLEIKYRLVYESGAVTDWGIVNADMISESFEDFDLETISLTISVKEYGVTISKDIEFNFQPSPIPED